MRLWNIEDSEKLLPVILASTKTSTLKMHKVELTFYLYNSHSLAVQLPRIEAYIAHQRAFVFDVLAVSTSFLHTATAKLAKISYDFVLSSV